MATFLKGDVVWLKTGGPKMTVSNPNATAMHSDDTLCECTWFEGGTVKTYKFVPETLTMENPEKSVKSGIRVG